VCLEETQKLGCPACLPGIIRCPFNRCMKKLEPDSWDEHYKKEHFGHLCMKNADLCPSCKFETVEAAICHIPDCDDSFSETDSFNEHFKKNHLPMTCDVCGDEFLSHQKKKHLNEICPYKIVHCPVPGCKQRVTQPLRIEALRDGGEKSIVFFKMKSSFSFLGDASKLVDDHDCSSVIRFFFGLGGKGTNKII